MVGKKTPAIIVAQKVDMHRQDSAHAQPPTILMMFPVCHFWRKRRVTTIMTIMRERQLILTRMPHTCGASWPAPKNRRACTKRAARHTIVLISLRRGKHHGRLPWSCNPFLCVCSALQMQSSRRRRQRSVWADRCSASEMRVFSSS